jgi:hypothetical protein
VTFRLPANWLSMAIKGTDEWAAASAKSGLDVLQWPHHVACTMTKVRLGELRRVFTCPRDFASYPPIGIATYAMAYYILIWDVYRSWGGPNARVLSQTRCDGAQAVSAAEEFGMHAARYSLTARGPP